MIVNKFGGASIKNSEAIKRMGRICKEFMSHGVIVVSAMGKTTNLLEQVVINYYNGTPYIPFRRQFEDYHRQIMEELFTEGNPIYTSFTILLEELDEKLQKKPGLNFDFEYDQIVSFGELLSTRIIAAYLNQQGTDAIWVDIRNGLKTDSTFREGRVDWELSRKTISNDFPNATTKLYLTQGFIGSDINNLTTTLGREGSDFTAAVIANSLNAEKVVVWKDVPGIMCADPDWIPESPKIDKRCTCNSSKNHQTPSKQEHSVTGALIFKYIRSRYFYRFH
jgi:aspartate kinase